MATRVRKIWWKRDIHWVATTLDEDAPLTKDDAPSKFAWSLRQWVMSDKANVSKFFDKYVANAHLEDMRIEKQRKGAKGDPHDQELIDRLNARLDAIESKVAERRK